MSAHGWYELLVWGYAIASVGVFISLLMTPAAYGRFDSADRAWWWGPGIPTRLAFVVMEAPSSLGFAVVFFLGGNAWQLAPLVLFAMWQAHYFQRSFIYPFKRKVRPGGTTPLLVPLSGSITNLGIAFINAAILSWISIRADYGLDWLIDPRFLIGLALFVAGYYINRKADALLAALRKPGEGGYRIPRGWLYERVSCPNYFGEILIWTGWAIATWSAAGVVFLLWTLANLLPRALSTHQWYREQFPDYPAGRKAVLPGIV